MKMVLIPPGEFMMGSSDEQVEAALKVADEIKADQATKDRIQKAERPQHKVVITKPFSMSSTEITIGQFRKCAAATGYQTEAEKAAQADAKVQTYLNPGYAVTDDSPASVITWNDAAAYCNWLSTQEKFVPAIVRMEILGRPCRERMAIACPRKRNGNTPVVPERRRNIRSVMSISSWNNMVGSKRLPLTARMPSVRSGRTRSASSTCTAT